MKILYKTDADVNAWTYYEKMYKDRMIIDIKKLKNSNVNWKLNTTKH